MGDTSLGWEVRGAHTISDHVLRVIRSRSFLVAIAFYAATAALLTIRIGDHPAFPYNWENYTSAQFWLVWDGNVPWTHLFRVGDGVMTKSGASPIVVLPIWLSFHLLGVGLAAFRLPTALICASGVPLIWLVGRRFVGEAAAAFAAALLALSPVYLLYGRTATYVGISMLVVVVTAGVLLRVALLGEGRRVGREEVAWILALQLALLVGIYVYAPVRALWPLSLFVLGVELAIARGRRVALVVALVTTAVVLPLTLSFAYGDKAGVIAKVHRYYGAGGEQVLSLGQGEYVYYLRGANPATLATESRSELALRLIAQNTGDYFNLLLDRGTQPTFREFWNHTGRLHSRLLAPFLLLGFAVAVWRVRRTEARVLLVLSVGLTVPILMTTHVEIGRLAPVVPLYTLLTALGFIKALGWLSKGADAVLGDRVKPAHRALAWRLVATIAALAIVAAVARTARASYYDVVIGAPPQANVQHFLGEKHRLAETTGGFVLVASDPGLEPLDVGGYRMGLSRMYDFVDIDHQRPHAQADARPKIVYGSVFDSVLTSRQWHGLMSFLRSTQSIHLCDYVFYVSPSAEESFDKARPSLSRACSHRIRWASLPQ